MALALSSVLKILLGPKGLCMFQHTQKSFSWLIKKRDLSLKKNFSRRVEKPREKLCLGWLLLLFVFRCFCLALEAACLCGSTSSSSTSSRCRDGSKGWFIKNQTHIYSYCINPVSFCEKYFISAKSRHYENSKLVRQV